MMMRSGLTCSWRRTSVSTRASESWQQTHPPAAPRTPLSPRRAAPRRCPRPRLVGDHRDPHARRLALLEQAADERGLPAAEEAGDDEAGVRADGAAIPQTYALAGDRPSNYDACPSVVCLLVPASSDNPETRPGSLHAPRHRDLQPEGWGRQDHHRGEPRRGPRPRRLPDPPRRRGSPGATRPAAWATPSIRRRGASPRPCSASSRSPPA